jgi:DNA helicase-2/ATP-dependent DNA helicase PcrA
LLADLKVSFPQVNLRDLKQKLKEFSAGWATRPHEEVFEEDDDQRRFKAAVVAWLVEHEAAMMEEIIYHAADLARQLGEQAIFPPYVLVDEYQDLNRLEQEFVDLIAARGQVLLVVGDPNQSIYSFKFAYPDGIIEVSQREGMDSHSSLVTGRCPRRVVECANGLLLQAAPGRTDLIQALEGAQDGEVHFVRKRTQTEEFEFVARSIAARIADRARPNEIIVLVPRRQLGLLFAEYANNNKTALGFGNDVKIEPIQKDELTSREREQLTLFGLVVNPLSLLHARTYVGLPDERFYADEITALKQQYGSLRDVLTRARPEDVPPRSRRHRVCRRIEELRRFLRTHDRNADLITLLDELFPRGEQETQAIRTILDGLIEEGDTAADLYGKYIDHTRSVPQDANTVRVMSLMASKGLQAEHVYIIGCNSGNIPGENRSVHLSNAEHRLEQLRLLYVGFTRATQSLTISWAREIPFSQSRRHSTPGVSTVRRGGAEPMSEVGLCEFLQALNVAWET